MAAPCNTTIVALETSEKFNGLLIFKVWKKLPQHRQTLQDFSMKLLKIQSYSQKLGIQNFFWNA